MASSFIFFFEAEWRENLAVPESAKMFHFLIILISLIFIWLRMHLGK